MCEDAITPKTKLHSWMYTLLYPAVLGTILFSFVNAIALGNAHLDGYKIGYGAFLMLYFSSQHIENTLDAKSYTIPKFISDVVELKGMLIFNIMLGLISTEYQIDGEKQVTWGCFFIVLTIVFLLPVFARLRDTKCQIKKYSRGWWLTIMSGVAALMAFVSIFVEINYWILIGLFILLTYYFVKFVFISPK